ncbi:short-chain dehydrogenase, partial [Variovorax sp. 2RAF20]
MTLRDTLVQSAPARIVTVASEASRQSGSLDINKDLLDTALFTARGSSRVYGRTKLLGIMFSMELARQLESTGVAVN